MPETPADELAIAIVGPATNLVLAVVLMIGGLAAGTSLWPPTLFAGPWVARLFWMNVLLGAFNLLPALPMDGGRVLRAALARRVDRRTATVMAARVARYLAVAMVVVGIFYDFWLVLIGIFVYLAAGAEEQGAGRADDHGGHPRSAPPADDRGDGEPPEHWHWPDAGLGPPGSGAAGGHGGT